MTKIQNAEHIMFSDVRVLRLAHSSYTSDHTVIHMYLNLVDTNFTVQKDWPET